MPRAKSTDFGSKARFFMVPLMGAALMVYFAYHIIQGDRGLIAWWNLRYEIEKTNADLAQVSAEKLRMERRVALLRPDSLDRDMLEERARVMLGFVHPDDRIVPEPKKKPARKAE